MDTMIPVETGWHKDFQEWLKPFLAVFSRSEQRCWAPLYLQGLLGPGARKSVEPMAERVCPGQTQQLHHFVSTSPWLTARLEQVLRQTADALVGGKDAALIVDDTALPKQGKHSVGVKRQHCGVLGKQANCQVLVSLTLARKEVPVPIALRLYLPEDWAQDKARRAAAEVSESITFETKGDIALAQIDAALADGVRFGMVLADAGYCTQAREVDTMQESNSSPVIATKRRHSVAFKRKLLELIEQPGASVAGVALEHGVNANLLFKWRRAKRERKRSAGTVRPTVLLPVTVVEPQESRPAATPDGHAAIDKEGVIEIEMGGARVVLRGRIDPASVRSVLMAIRETA